MVLKPIILVVLAVLVAAVVAQAPDDGGNSSGRCNTHTTCFGCTSNYSWTRSNCRWCPKEEGSQAGNCHAEGSLANNCSRITQVTDPSQCGTLDNLRPTQLHIALADDGDARGMTISWATSGATTSSTVHYGTSEDLLKTAVAAAGDVRNYIGRNHYHHVTLAGLAPSTRYYYKAGDDSGGWSVIRSFPTAPAAGQPFTASVFGDWGYGTDGHAVDTLHALNTLTKDVDLVLHLGDISYADDGFLHDPAGFSYEAIYDGWMNWISNMSDRLPYMVAAGNHEAECHSPSCMASPALRSALSNFTAYNSRWKMPYQTSQGSSNMWYSFNYGNTHFIVIDSETDFKGAGEQKRGPLLPSGSFGQDGEFLAWLEADLQAAHADRDVHPWIIAGGHRPIYDGQAIAGEMQTAFEELFNKYEVDLYVSGHVHSYARSFPVFQSNHSEGYVDAGKPTYIVIGGAGCDEMIISKAPKAPAPWTAFQDTQHYGTGILAVPNRTHLHWSYVDSVDLKVLDEIWVVKK